MHGDFNLTQIYPKNISRIIESHCISIGSTFYVSRGTTIFLSR